MDGPGSTFQEIRTIFAGSLPRVFERMHEAGELDQHWPGIRAVLVEPEPLTPAVVQALFIVFSIRCSSQYCFVLHSLTLSSLGVDEVAISELARLLEMPALEPDHERWSRVLKLAWLAYHDGPQRGIADLLLRDECSEAEYARIAAVHRANAAINSFTVAPALPLEGEPMLDTFPDSLRALVPQFVQFHTVLQSVGDGERPVSTMCSVCRKLRSLDGQWYPSEVVVGMLAPDSLFSHGLCSTCAQVEHAGHP